MIAAILASASIAAAGTLLDIWSTEKVFRKYPQGVELNWHLFGGSRPTFRQLLASDAILALPYAGLLLYAAHVGLAWGVIGAGLILGGWHVVGFLHNIKQ